LIGVAAAYKGLRFAISSVKEFADFEMGLANVSTMLDNATMKYMPGYEKQVKKLAREFGQSTGTLSKGLYDILSASVSADKAIKVLRVSSRAAIAGLTDTGTAADVLTTILNSYGLEAEEASKISDILFATVKAGKITFGELAGSIGKVSSLAAAVGLDFTEVSAAISTMTRAGVSSDIAMTSLKGILTTFLSPQKENILVAAKHGLALNANTLRTIGLTGAIEKLKGATEEDIAAIFSNVRALTGVAAIRGNLTGLIEDQEKATNSLGKTEQAYQKIAETTGQQLKQLTEDWKAMKVAAGSFFLKIPGFITEAGKLLDTLEELREAQKRAGRGGRTPMIGFGGDYTPKAAKSQKIVLPSIEFLGRQPKEVVENLIKDLEVIGQHVPGPIRQLLEPAIEQVEKLNKAAKELKRFNEALAKMVPTINLPAMLEEKIKPKETKEEQKYIDDQAKAYRRLYDDLSQMGKTNYDFRKQLLDEERKEYEIFIKDKILLEEWYAGRKAEIDNEMMIASDNFFAGFGAGIDQMKLDLTTWGEVGASVAQTLKSATSEAVISMTSDWSSWESALEGIGISVAKTAQKMIADMITMQIISAAIGGIGGLFGGGAGTTFENPMAIFGAPSAKGNIFNNGSIVPFAKGDILNRPTIFPMSNGGVGLGGEAGAEAIMPLGRDKSGRLGVRAEGDGGSKQPIKIINIMDQSEVNEYLNSADGEKTIVNIMRRNSNEINV